MMMDKLGFKYYPYKVTQIIYHDEVTLFYEDFSGKCHWPYEDKKRNLQYIRDLMDRVTPVKLIFDWGRITIWTENKVLCSRGFDQKLSLMEDKPPKVNDNMRGPGTVYYLGEGRKTVIKSVHPPVPTLLEYTMQYGEDNSPTSAHYTAFIKRYLKGEIYYECKK